MYDTVGSDVESYLLTIRVKSVILRHTAFGREHMTKRWVDYIYGIISLCDDTIL